MPMRILETVALTPHSTPPHRVIAMPIIRSFGVRSNVFPVTTRFLPCTSLRSSHTVHAYMSFYHTSHVRFGRNGHMEQRLMGRCVRFTRNGHTEYGFWIANVRFGRIGHSEGENLKSTTPGANPEIPATRQPRDPGNPATRQARQPAPSALGTPSR